MNEFRQNTRSKDTSGEIVEWMFETVHDEGKKTSVCERFTDAWPVPADMQFFILFLLGLVQGAIQSKDKIQQYVHV